MTKLGVSWCLVLGGLSLFLACGEDGDKQRACSLEQPTSTCPDAQVCEEVGGRPACVAALVVRGRVHDSAGAGIVGTLVSGLDENGAPLTGTATTGADGGYELRVPAPRSADGAALVRQVHLRAAAAGFEAFPSGLRRSLPIEISAALATPEGKLAFSSPGTDVLLQRLASSTGLGTIAGTVLGASGARGVLVVAEGPGVATSISDSDGSYVIFNVLPGTYVVRGYAAGVQLSPATVMVTAGARAEVPLSPGAAALGRISGSVNIVNAPGGAMTSVVLVVASTFNQALKRGEVPPGLRAPRPGSAPSVAGPFEITGVPDGDYVVLAAFENDGLVRDPDTSIGGTQIQRVSVGEAGRQVALPASFKITESLAILSPGAGETPEVMDGVPTFVWKDDSSEERYGLEVLDAKGNIVWSNDQVPKQTGGEVSVAYSGPALAPASLFQFRVTSFRKGNVPVSQSEELRGVFQTR
jgi:hypothetical protein